MKIVLAPNAYKGSLSAAEAAAAMAIGVRQVFPDAEILEIPVADGGDGLTDILAERLGGTKIELPVTGAMGEKRLAQYAFVTASGTAIMNVADCCGLSLVPAERRDPELTTTIGLGEYIRDAVARGARHILIGLGGSSSIDAGMGMASALGVVFRDEAGNPLLPIGANLSKVIQVDANDLDSRLGGVSIDVICDVDNPLYGPTGAARVFGPQKGASPAAVSRLDAGLRHFSAVCRHQFGVDVAPLPGSGAAGGLGAGLALFLNAKLRPGIEVVLDQLDFDRLIEHADLVLTGEGCMDDQTLSGKAPVGVARRCARQAVPCVAIAGKIAIDKKKFLASGFTEVLQMSPPGQSLDQSMRNATSNLTAATMRYLRDQYR